jgi:bacillopeptidase F
MMSRLVKEVKSAGTKKRLGVEKQPAKMKDKKTKKQTIDPKKAKPAETVQEHSETKKAAPAVLPVRAQVSVLETGKSTYSNQATGAYSLAHAPGTYTLKAEAYGYESNAQTRKNRCRQDDDGRLCLKGTEERDAHRNDKKQKNGRTRPTCKAVYR